MIAAAEKNIPIVVPGWEDSTMGNIFAPMIKGELKATTMKSGIEYMVMLSDWYRTTAARVWVSSRSVAARGTSICVVSMMYQDLEWHDVPFWGYFCQISDLRFILRRRSQREDHLGKLDIHTPKYIIESDATIVAPLIFAYLVGVVSAEAFHRLR